MNNTIVGIVQLIALRLWRVGAIPIHSSISWMEETPVGLPDSLQAHHRTNESLRINACFEGARSAQWLAPKLLCRKKSGAARIILASTLQASACFCAPPRRYLYRVAGAYAWTESTVGGNTLAGRAGKSPALSAPFSTGDCRQHHSKEQALRVLQEKKGGVS